MKAKCKETTWWYSFRAAGVDLELVEAAAEAAAGAGAAGGAAEGAAWTRELNDFRDWPWEQERAENQGQCKNIERNRAS